MSNNGFFGIVTAMQDFLLEALPKHGLSGKSLDFKGFSSELRSLKKGDEYSLTLNFDVIEDKK